MQINVLARRAGGLLFLALSLLVTWPLLQVIAISAIPANNEIIEGTAVQAGDSGQHPLLLPLALILLGIAIWNSVASAAIASGSQSWSLAMVAMRSLIALIFITTFWFFGA